MSGPTDERDERRSMVSIGHVHRAVGLDGTVEVEVYSGDPGRLAPSTRVTVSGRSLVVETARAGRRGSLAVRFAGVSDRDQADSLRGAEIEVPESTLPVAGEGSYYHYQVMGCRVVDLEGKELGKVAGIIQTGANDVYVVERPGGGEVLVPAVRTVIKIIDIAEGVITIDPPHGLIE